MPYNNVSVSAKAHMQNVSHKIILLSETVDGLVHLSSLYDVHIRMKSPNDAFLRMYLLFVR